MKYKYLLFDADNTLFDFDKCEFNAFLSLGNIIPTVFTEENYCYYHDINNSLWKDAEKGLISKNELKVERFKRFLSKLEFPDRSISCEELSDLYLKCLAEENLLIEFAVDTLRYLQQNYKIYIITNGIASVQRKRFNNSEIKNHIDGIFISEEIGFDKPDKRYFNTVMTEIGSLDPKEYLVIGDSLSSDIAGAKNSAIDSVYFQKNPPFIHSDDAKYNITSLISLKDIL